MLKEREVVWRIIDIYIYMHMYVFHVIPLMSGRAATKKRPSRQMSSKGKVS